jgi:hypothetical protein
MCRTPRSVRSSSSRCSCSNSSSSSSGGVEVEDLAGRWRVLFVLWVEWMDAKWFWKLWFSFIPPIAELEEWRTVMFILPSLGHQFGPGWVDFFLELKACSISCSLSCRPTVIDCSLQCRLAAGRHEACASTCVLPSVWEHPHTWCINI